MTTFEIFDFHKQEWVEIEVNSDNIQEFHGYVIEDVLAYETPNDYKIRLASSKVNFVGDDYNFKK